MGGLQADAASFIRGFGKIKRVLPQFGLVDPTRSTQAQINPPHGGEPTLGKHCQAVHAKTVSEEAPARNGQTGPFSHGEVPVKGLGKNSYERTTPCDQDTLRKAFKNVPAVRWQDWYNTGIQEVYQRYGFFDPAGIFVGDGTYSLTPPAATALHRQQRQSNSTHLSRQPLISALPFPTV